ncbi:MAG: GGDEF domain-containing protein, partial [Gammaproteobacteria bacterium]|nr:GGDEF domain-containing protein [Gammaproteobacteria bacterium]
NLLLILGLLFWTVQHFIWANSFQLGYNKTLMFNLLAVLVPLNILGQNLLLERGNFSLPGLKRISLILLQILLVSFILWADIRSLNKVLAFNLLEFLWPTTSVMPGMANTLFVITGMVLGWRFYRAPTLLNITQPALLIAVWIALYFAKQSLYGSLFISIAGGILLLAIMLNSYNLAYIDELTSLPSRRALKQELMSVGNRYCVAMLDIDHFKKLNDTYGHDVGDQILRMVASRIRRCPGCSRVYRYGGEEFTIVFPNKNLDEARVAAKAVCQKIAEAPFSLRGKRRPRKKPGFIGKPGPVKKIDVTISIGVAQKREKHTNAQEVLKDADKALYRAKESGRNRVCT